MPLAPTARRRFPTRVRHAPALSFRSAMRRDCVLTKELLPLPPAPDANRETDHADDDGQASQRQHRLQGVAPEVDRVDLVGDVADGLLGDGGVHVAGLAGGGAGLLGPVDDEAHLVGARDGRGVVGQEDTQDGPGRRLHLVRILRGEVEPDLVLPRVVGLAGLSVARGVEEREGLAGHARGDEHLNVPPGQHLPVELVALLDGEAGGLPAAGDDHIDDLTLRGGGSAVRRGRGLDGHHLGDGDLEAGARVAVDLERHRRVGAQHEGAVLVRLVVVDDQGATRIDELEASRARVADGHVRRAVEGQLDLLSPRQGAGDVELEWSRAGGIEVRDLVGTGLNHGHFANERGQLLGGRLRVQGRGGAEDQRHGHHEGDQNSAAVHFVLFAVVYARRSHYPTPLVR